MLLQESAETAAVVLFLLSPFYTGQSVLPENSLQAVGPDIRSLRCSFSPKGFYRWGVRGLINHLSAQFAYSKFTGKTSHFNLQPVVAASFTRFLYLFFFFSPQPSLTEISPALPTSSSRLRSLAQGEKQRETDSFTKTRRRPLF